VLTITPATPTDSQAIWSILKPILRSGETYAPRDWKRREALEFWNGGDHSAFVAREESRAVGTYYLHANQRGGRAHVANCGYATALNQAGRGVATQMCQHSLHLAASLGFRAMLFNCVVSTNERAVSLWLRLGFEIVGTVPGAFEHPDLGYVDTFVMHRSL
jgi:ribosomal protein S18 acetylase RimI-like enzyme